MTSAPSKRAFTLVEVVFALAVFVFVAFALFGLLGVGLQNSADSRQRTQAATIMEQICSVRRAAPTNDFTGAAPQPNFPLPVLDQNSAVNNFSQATYLTRDGQSTATAQNASFGFLYSITPTYYGYPAGNPSATSAVGVAQVYMCIYWPAAAKPTNANTGRYEVTTTFSLP